MPEVTFTAKNLGAFNDLQSYDESTYSNALNGTGTILAQGNTSVGQYLATGYACFESFLEFETNTLPSNITILSVELKLYLALYSTAGSDFTVQARPYEFTVPISSSNWRNQSQVSGDTPILATWDTTGNTTLQYYTMVEGSDFKYNINTNKSTKIYLVSDRQAAGTSPTTAEWCIFYSPLIAGKEPQLVINYVSNVDFGAVV